ncbi:MAG: serine/threonine-protein kinase, partial [Phycisphaerae bacterium]
MQDERPEPCPQRELVEAFAHDQLDDAERREAERLLEQSEPCRELFRQLTAGRYPRLPNYTIIGQIGKGGFGVVYKAIHHAKERIEALKILFSKTPLLTSYFENEVHLIARLRHANIATLYEAQLSTPPLYYTMEFVEGERLNDYLKRHEVSLAARIDIIKSVARAVGYAHTKGVVHRDLKPQNVLLDREGQPHVVDFGIAKKLALVEARLPEAEGASQKDHEGAVGTLGYIAPEQEKGGPIDERADIYALGALLFHCVSGEPARLASVPDQRIRILRERQVAQPDDLAAIIARCVKVSPSDRYATCADFVADLDNYLSSRPIDAREDRTWVDQVFRIAALVMRESPVTVRTAVLILVAAFLTWYFWAVEAWTSGGRTSGDRTVLIGFTDKTVEAVKEGRIGADLPGLSAYNAWSWRILYGKLMERLAEASPRVVVWDGWFDKCSDFDEQLVRGLRALRASDVPVIVGALRFDLNGEPEICPAIRTEIDGYGTVFGTETGKHQNVYEVAHCIQRGYEWPIPGLALAAFAACRFRDCDYRLRLDADARRLYLQYRKRNPAGKPTWEEDPDYLPLHEVATVEWGKGDFDDF